MDTLSFRSVHDKSSSSPIRKSLLEWCPTMDLLAMISDSDEVILNRLSGQRVWSIIPSIPKDTKTSPCKLTWRPDGKVLVVGFDNGDTHFVDVNDGKIVNIITHQKTNASNSAITVLRWMESNTGNVAGKLNQGVNFDVRSQLPHLAALPNSGVERAFISAQAVETLIHDLERETEQLRFLSIGSEDRHFSLVIGSFYLNLGQRFAQHDVKYLTYDASTDLVTHGLLSISASGCFFSLSDMNAFQSMSTSFTHSINTFNDFDTVSSYLLESIGCLEEENSVMEDTRAVGLMKLADFLEEGRTPKTELLQLLLSGSASTQTIEWLENYLTDRLVRKWDKVSSASLENMRRIILDSSLPACDRLIIMLSKLKDMSTDTSTQTGTNLMTVKIGDTIQGVTFIIAQLYAMLNAISTELKLFSAFCKWLYFVFSRISADDEHPDTAMPVNINRVKEYICDHHPDGSMSKFFHSNAQIWHDSPEAAAKLGPYHDVGTAGCPGLKQAYDLMASKGQEIFIGPANMLTGQWQEKEIFKIGNSPEVLAQIRFVDAEAKVAFIAYVDLLEDPSHVYVVMCEIGSSKRSIKVCKIEFAKCGLDELTIVDITFIDDMEILVLARGGKPEVVSHLIGFSFCELEFQAIDLDDGTAICRHDLPGKTVLPSKYRALDPGVQPICIAVNGNRGRRTGVFLQNDRQRYTVFDLDDAEPEESSPEDGDDGSEMEE